MGTKKKKGLNWFTKVAIIGNALFTLLLLLSYLSPWVKPASSWPLIFLGMAYPVFLWFNLGFMVFWFFFNWRFAGVSLFAIVLGYSHFFNYISIGKGDKGFGPEVTTLKVLSYNVRNFDFFNSLSRVSPNFENRNKIFDYLANEDFDIICFQEFIQDNSSKFPTTDTLQRLLKANNVHFQHSKSRGSLFFGLATYSSYPIIGRGKIEFPTRAGNLGIFTDVLINKDTVRIFNIHLESIGLSKEDVMLFDNIVSANDQVGNPDYSVGLRRIAGRIRDAAITRTLQAKIVSEHIKFSRYPVILAGDFNDTPFSYSYRKIKGNLKDSFKSGGGIGGSTYIWSYPFFRIDFLFHSQTIRAKNFKTGKEKYSDHYPISVTFAIQHTN